MQSLYRSTLVLAVVAFGATAFARGQAGDEDASAPPPRTAKAVPQLGKAPNLSSDLKDMKAGFTLTTPAWSGKVGFKGDTLYLGVNATDDRVLAGDILEVTLFFSGAGLTARGYTWRFGPEGPRPSSELPPFVPKLTKAEVQRSDAGITLKMGIPARALPRFPAAGPLVFDLCVSFSDRDEPAGSPAVTSNCKSGTMEGDALKLPDSFRNALKLKPPETVEGLEGREQGWVGYAVLHYPQWVQSDVALTAPVLRSLVAEKEVDPKKVGINLPDALLLPDNRALLSVLSGDDPYAVQGACDADKELRVALYVAKGRTAERVLDWPASSCPLGRAAAFELNEDGELSIGYTNGSTAHFIWAKDHFERTEIGSR